MKSAFSLFAVLSAIALSGVQAQVGDLCYAPGSVGKEGSWPGDDNETQGVCLTTSSCSSLGGKAYAGHCPGASNIQCCVSPKCGPAGSRKVEGFCAGYDACQNMYGYDGDAYSGYCPGPSNYRVRLDTGHVCCSGTLINIFHFPSAAFQTVIK
ncbi:hypothetical protein INT43_000142 [Umbelopsis isabellina]|uniref:Uncharacterized protein n=1 Tax=Mortierella isabellina TaxID=91625 RepID=A0A8H7PFM4_MORIS|nr:hypothetical protein INT43_000142 [Umbelopsis isabellina]